MLTYFYERPLRIHYTKVLYCMFKDASHLFIEPPYESICTQRSREYTETPSVYDDIMSKQIILRRTREHSCL